MRDLRPDEQSQVYGGAQKGTNKDNRRTDNHRTDNHRTDNRRTDQKRTA